MTEALLKVLDEDGVVAKVTCMCALQHDTQNVHQVESDGRAGVVYSMCVCPLLVYILYILYVHICSVYCTSVPPPSVKVLG